MSVSATTNAGFDIVGHSLIQFADDYFIQFINIILIIFGSIGYAVLIEVKTFLTRKSAQSVYQFSLYTKLTITTFFGLIAVGTLLILVLEYNHFFCRKELE